tara:strand:+ start:734 stop:1189 length:456 start_codon:yes stop_codon:yes gene_type:complete
MDEIPIINTLENCLLNLKIISKIEENDKLITKEDILKIDKPEIFQGIKRWFSKEKRDIAVERLNEIYKKSFDITDELLENDGEIQNNILEDSNSQIFQKFIIQFTNSLYGIENLKKTYSKDIPMIAHLDMISTKLNTRLEKMNKICTISLK